MKTSSHTSTPSSRTSARPRAPARQPDDYVPAAQVRALLANSLVARQARLAADDMISTDDAAAVTQTSRVTVNSWINKGRAIGLNQSKRGLKLPRWQFEPVLWDALPKISAAMGVTEGWALLAFLETPHGALGGTAPRQAIEQGQVERVIALARGEGH
jgi:hypothetical protein